MVRPLCVKILNLIFAVFKISTFRGSIYMVINLLLKVIISLMMRFQGFSFIFNVFNRHRWKTHKSASTNVAPLGGHLQMKNKFPLFEENINKTQVEAKCWKLFLWFWKNVFLRKIMMITNFHHHHRPICSSSSIFFVLHFSSTHYTISTLISYD